MPDIRVAVFKAFDQPRNKVVAKPLKLFEGIPTAVAYRVDGQHDAVVSQADTYVPLLEEACGYVVAKGTELRRSA